MTSQSDSLTPGTTFGTYRIVRELGRGGMGVVYEAESLGDGRIVALKLLLAGMDADEARMRFLREGRVASTLMHPNTVYVYGTQEIDGLPTIAMEYVAGGTLEDLVRDKGPMPAADAARVIGQVIDGLEAAHAGGILHRDIKPSNCFIAQDGSVKVGDFGLSRPTDGGEDMRVTRTGMILGTPAYAPPEQLLGESLDVRSDIYSVGATLYYLLTGVLPFPGANPMVVLASVLQGAPVPPETHKPEIPKALSTIVLRAMARQPGERFATYAEFRAALDALAGVEHEPARPVARIIAMIIDVTLTSAIAEGGIALIGGSTWGDKHKGWEALIACVVFLLLRALPESRWGTSPGKRLLGLRTIRVDGGPLSALTSIGRAAVLLLPNFAGPMLKGFPAFATLSEVDGNIIGTVLGLVLLSTMRRSNGYAALHDRIFSTRVVRMRENRTVRRFARGATRVAEIPTTGERVGTFVLGNVVFTLPDSSVVHDAVDASLGRPVWLHRVSAAVPEISMARRNLARPARMRWVAGRRDVPQPFDVYGTPEGQRLVDLPSAVSWEICRGWIEDLAAEMAAATTDGDTLRPAIDDLWVSSGQQVIIMDFARAVPQSNTSAQLTAGAILHAVARRALCGPNATASSPWPMLPSRVRALLDTLPTTADPASVVAALAGVRGTAAQVTRDQRVRIAVLTGIFPLIFGIATMFAVVPSELERSPLRQALRPMIREVARESAMAAVPRDSNFSYRVGRALGRVLGAPGDSATRAARRAAIDARRLTIRQYLATTHGALLRDRTRRVSVIGDSLQWADLDSVFMRLGPVSPADSLRAWQVVEQEWGGTLPEQDLPSVRAVSFSIVTFHVVLLLTGAFVGLLALFARRGPVMRSVGVEVVNRLGQPASRFRVLVRAIATWGTLTPLPTLLMAIWGVLRPTGTLIHPVFWIGGVASGISLTLGALVLAYGIWRPTRGVGDLVAGTVTVPE